MLTLDALFLQPYHIFQGSSSFKFSLYYSPKYLSWYIWSHFWQWNLYIYLVLGCDFKEVMYACVLICHLCTGSCGDQKVLELELQAWTSLCRCWQLKSCPWQEHQVLLTTDVSPLLRLFFLNMPKYSRATQHSQPFLSFNSVYVAEVGFPALAL